MGTFQIKLCDMIILFGIDKTFFMEFRYNLWVREHNFDTKTAYNKVTMSEKPRKKVGAFCKIFQKFKKKGWSGRENKQKTTKNYVFH